jgi:hypothetical protein
MRVLAIIAAILTLAACSEPTAPGSPADADIRKAILRYYATAPGNTISRWDPNNMRYAAILATGRCKALNEDFFCQAWFDHPDQGRVQRRVWMAKEAGDWKMILILADMPPEPLL